MPEPAPAAQDLEFSPRLPPSLTRPPGPTGRRPGPRITAPAGRRDAKGMVTWDRNASDPRLLDPSRHVGAAQAAIPSQRDSPNGVRRHATAGQERLWKASAPFEISYDRDDLQRYSACMAGTKSRVRAPYHMTHLRGQKSQRCASGSLRGACPPRWRAARQARRSVPLIPVSRVQVAAQITRSVCRRGPAPSCPSRTGRL